MQDTATYVGLQSCYILEYSKQTSSEVQCSGAVSSFFFLFQVEEVEEEEEKNKSLLSLQGKRKSKVFSSLKLMFVMFTWIYSEVTCSTLVYMKSEP